MDESSEFAAELAPRAAEIEAMLRSDKPLAASATIYNPCNCDAGQPLWYYKPARRTFSFANLDGNVERIEAWCETHRIRDAVKESKSWAHAPVRPLLRGTMAWIEEIEVSDADEKLAEIYATLIKQRGKISNILKVHSLNPDALDKHLDLYMSLMFGQSGLSRAEREAIAVVVSANNDCQYCVNHHAEALKRFIKDEQTLEMLKNADGLETLEPRLSNIVRHAEKLTTAPGAMTESDLAELGAVGLTDRDVLDLTLVVAYFNFVNRIALGLGVTFSDDELSGYLEQ